MSALEADDLIPTGEERQTPRKKSTGEFLARWIRGSRAEGKPGSADNETDDDEDDDDNEKTSAERPNNRFMKLARGLFNFRGLVQKETIKTEPISLLDRLKTNKQEAPVTDQPGPLEAEPDLHVELAELTDSSESEQVLPPENTVESEAVEEPEATDDDEEETKAAPVTPLATKRRMPPLSSGGSPPPRAPGGGSPPPRPPVPPIGGRPASGSPPSGGGGIPSPAFGPSRPPETIIIHERERIIERSNNRLAALAVLGLGAEYLARKRAVNKQERRFDKKIEAIKKEHRPENLSVQTKIEQLAPFSREEAKQVITRERQFEQQLQDQKNTKEAPLLKVENRSMMYEKQQEKSISPTEVGPQKPELYMANTTEKTRLERPAMAQPEAIKLPASEAKVIEQLYERRHEVKDDDAVAAATHAASVGSILAQQRSVTNTQPAGSLDYRSTPPAASIKESAKSTTQGANYKQAMTMGLWGALIIIIFGALVYFLT